jgi:hypothetical protein
LIKSRGRRWAEHVAHLGSLGNICKILVRKLEGEKHFEGLGVDERWILKT